MHRLFHPPIHLGDLHHRLERIKTHQRDEIRPASDLRLEEDTGFLRTNGSTHLLQPHARRLLAQKLRIPDSYLGRCPHELAAENVNHFLREKGSQPLMIRYEGNQIRAILSDRYKAVDHPELTRQLLDVVPESTPVRYELSATMTFPRFSGHRG